MLGKDSLVQVGDLLAAGRVESRGQYTSLSLPSVSVDRLVDKEDRLLFDCGNFRDGSQSRFTLYRALDGAVLNFIGDVYLGPMLFAVIENGTERVKVLIEQGKTRDHEEDN